MRFLTACAILLLSFVSIQCSSSGSSDERGLWGQAPLRHGGNQTVSTSAPGSKSQLLRQVNLKVNNVPRNTRLRSSLRPMQPQFITIHSTENYSPTGDADQHAKALNACRLPAIWHFTVDDHHAVEHLPLNVQGIHADINHPGYSAPGNRVSIGIEMCENKGNNLGVTVERTAKLTAYLMCQTGIPLSRVVPHYHWPREGRNPPNKNCPHFLMDNGRPGRKWQWFLSRVNYYYKSVNQANYASN